jgi:hypothetical protein
MDAHSFRQALALRSFWLGVKHPNWSREDIRNLAAQQLADEEREQRERARHERRPPPAEPRDARERLIARIMAMWARLAASPSTPPAPASDHRSRRLQAASAPLQPPTRTPRRFPRSMRERLVEAFTSEPEPSPPEPQQPVYQGENSNAMLIPDEEYSKRFQDVPTRNWRRSIEANEKSFAERRGHPPSSRIVR